MKKSVILLAIVTIGLSSCYKQESEEIIVSKDLFTTSFEEFDAPTKTALASNRAVLWSAGDRVAVFQGSTIADEYSVSSASAGKSNGTLEYVGNDAQGTGDFNAGIEIPCNVAYYPYSRNLSLSGSYLDADGVYRVSNTVIPGTQVYTPNSFSNGSFPMVAVTDNESDFNLKFKNVLGVLKLQLTGTQIVKSIEVKGNLEEPLAGSATVTVFSDNQRPQISLEGGNSSVKLYCGEGVQLNEHKVTEFMIALPPTKFTNGFTVCIADAQEDLYKISTNVANEVKRSSILVMPPVSLEDKDPYVDDRYGKYSMGYEEVLTGIYENIVSMNWSNQFFDPGSAEFVRAFWTIQELPADALKCAWGDAYINSLNQADFSACGLIDPVYAVYLQCLNVITSVNDFLRNTTEDKLEERGCSGFVKKTVMQYRAEARFLRAYFYWVAMDVFGMFPFTTEFSSISEFNPSQLPRKELFEYIVQELEDLSSDNSEIPAARANYPRADKGTVLGLLARVYINAEVYTGRPRWQEAREACDRIFSLGYTLAPTHAELFRADNGENSDARGEILFAAPYDSKAMSYGGTTFIVSSSLSGDDNPGDIVGLNSGWAGNRVPYDYVRRWFPDVKKPNYKTGEYVYTDERAGYFYIKGRKESMEYNLNTFLNGWSFIKFNNNSHDGVSYGWDKNFSDIDFPLIRLGEIYLIYAEACYRLGLQQEALAKLRELAARAGAELPTEVTEEYILAERSRELMWEGHRRTDLIRFGKWIHGYNWTYKGGVYYGQDLPSHYTLYPIPQREINMNPDLMQNPGY